MMRRLIRGSTLSLNSQYDIAGDSSYRKFCRRRYFRQFFFFFFFLVQSKAVIWQPISKVFVFQTSCTYNYTAQNI